MKERQGFSLLRVGRAKVRTVHRSWERRSRRAPGRSPGWTSAIQAIALVCVVLALAIPAVAAQGQATPPPGATPAAGDGADAPVTCHVGIALVDLYHLDIEGDSFDAEFWIWSLCPDDRYLPLSTMEFVNANSVSMRLESEDIVDGVHWHYARVEGTFRFDWDETDFPFDRHNLRIVMEEPDAYVHELAYVPDIDGQIHEPDLRLPGWRIDAASLTADTHTYHTAYGDPAATDATSDYARLVLAIELERNELTSFIKLTILAYIAFVISMINFVIHPMDRLLLAGRLTITSATLFAVALSLRAVSSDLNSGNRVTLIDWIHVTALAAILIDAIAALTTWHFLRQGRSEAGVSHLNQVVMVTVAIVFVAVNILLIGWTAMR